MMNKVTRELVLEPGNPLAMKTTTIGQYNLIESPQILEMQEQVRYTFLQATRSALSSFHHRFFQGNERVLEVGSGLGFLRRNWPSEFKGKWSQLDFQIPFLEYAKRIYPEGTYVCGSADFLPFPSKSFDVVCGLASYDELPDLEKAVQEASRVLKEGGLFLHLLDVVPSNRTQSETPTDDDFHTRLYRTISQNFDPLTIEQGHAMGIAKHRMGELHRKTRTRRKDYIFANVAGHIYVTDYNNLGFEQFLERELTYVPKEVMDLLRPHRNRGLASRLSRITHLAKIEEPPVLEISAIKYLVARK